jgi:hypothetical protein
MRQAAAERSREWAMGFRMPVDFKGTVMNFKGTVESLLERRRPTEYVDADDKPPDEWREAVRPSGSSGSREEETGIEVLELTETSEIVEVEEQPTGFATVVETHFRIRCECGRRWWALDLSPTTCPRCNRTVAIQSAV